MPETVEKTVSTKKNRSAGLVNPFCKTPEYSPELPHNKFVYRVKTLEVDNKDTASVKPVFEKVDIMEEVRAAEDLAGVDYMKKLLATGQARPGDFAWDFKSDVVDTTVFPDSPHEAAKLAAQGNDQLAKLAEELGLPKGSAVSGEVLEKYLTDLVTKKFNEAKAAADNKEGE